MATDTQWKVIEAKILNCARHLRRQGALCAKLVGGRAVWRLRFVEHAVDHDVHRTIHIGSDPEHVRRATDLLARCRMQGQWRGELREATRLTGLGLSALGKLPSGRKPTGFGGKKPPV